MPADLVPAFTMGNQIELGEFFVDDTIGGKVGTPCALHVEEYG